MARISMPDPTLDIYGPHLNPRVITHPRTGKRPPSGKAKLPGTTIALMSFTAKLGVPSWGMTAELSCPGKSNSTTMARIALHSKDLEMRKAWLQRQTCNYCYARGGMYTIPAVANAYSKRYEWAVRCMKSEEGFREFVDTMTAGIALECRRMKVNAFRHADSGDFFNPRYVKAWIEIASNLPHIHFWAPTRSWRIPAILPFLIQLNALPNFTVSPSGLENDGDIPEIPGLDGGSVVVTTREIAAEKGAYLCPCPDQGGVCGKCTFCYRGKPRLYLIH